MATKEKFNIETSNSPSGTISAIHSMSSWSVFLFGVVGALLLTLSACKKNDEKPPTVPEVKTKSITDVTTGLANATGEIVSNGNATVTKAGFVYSNTVAVPTLSDKKVEITDTEGEFTAMLGDLTSGTLYHVRAFATNSAGTGYGEVVDFTTGNAGPTATNVLITGVNKVNEKLTASYTYADAESDAEGVSLYQWYMANDAAGAGEAVIAGATSKDYTVEASLEGKYIRVGVTPKALAGTNTGSEVKSTFTAAIGEATTITFTYNGAPVTYGILISTTTSKRWLDRNLGASAVASGSSDFANYGDLFQWGRAADGHQVVTRSGATDADATLTPTTNTQATTPTVGNANFITPTVLPRDWINPQDPTLWQGVNGINNPCPAGWRLPTTDEFNAEAITDITDGFNKLKFTLSGFRQRSGVYSSSNQGWYWTSTITPAPATSSMHAVFTNSAYDIPTGNRANGAVIRCIKN